MIKMYNKEFDRLIELAPNIATIRVYHKLMKMEPFKGGIVTSKKFIANELKLSSQYVGKVFEWLIKSNFVIKTTLNGQTQFILNKLEESTNDESSKIEHKQENHQPKQEVVRKGGKTITRMMVEGF